MAQSAWTDPDLLKAPMQDLLKDPLYARLASVGKHALESGKVSPEEAKANAAQMGLTGGNPMAMGAQPIAAPKSALDMSTPLPGQPRVAAMGVDSPNAASEVPQTAPQDAPDDDPRSIAQLPNENPRSYFKRQLVLSQDDATKKQQNKYMDPDDVKAAMDVVRQSPENQDLKAGDDRMQGLLSMIAGNQNVDPGWIKPILALADSQTGSKLMQGYTAPQNSQDTMKELLKYADEIQKRKTDIMKSITSGVSAQKNGGFNLVTSNTGSKDTGVQGEGSPTGGSQLAQTRRNALIAKSSSDFDKDPMLLRFAKTSTALDRGQSMLSSKEPITATDLQALQQDLLTAFTQDGVVTEGKAQREIVDPFASIINRMTTRGDSIQDIRRDTPDLIKHLQSRLNLMKQDYNKAGDQRTTELETNWKDVPDDLIQSTVARKAAILRAKFNPGQTPATSPSGKTPTISPDVAAYAQSHGISVQQAQALKDSRGGQ